MADINTYMVDLSRVLDRIRDALVDGDFEAVEKLAVSQDQLSSNISLLAGTASEPSKIKSAVVQHKAERNQRLLESALSGVRWARRRLDDITRAQNSPRTYDISGKSTALSPTRGLERRS